MTTTEREWIQQKSMFEQWRRFIQYIKCDQLMMVIITTTITLINTTGDSYLKIVDLLYIPEISSHFTKNEFVKLSFYLH